MSNHMSKLLKTVFCLLAVSMIFACAARTPVQQVAIADLQGNLKYENIVFKKFDAAPHVPNPAQSIVLCKNTAISHLKAKNLFKRVEDNTDNEYDGPVLIVEATITDLRIVSGKARFWGGVLAGRSHIKLSVTLMDASTGEVVERKELMGAPNSLGSVYSFGASDRGLSQTMGVLLGDYVLTKVGN